MFLAALFLLAVRPAVAAELVYELDPVDLGGGCHALIGSEDYFDTRNGGYIVNTGFILTDAGAVVIDTGPSIRFGRQLRAMLDEMSGDAGINRVLITHGHPDHYLGNQAFDDVPIHAGAGTRALIELSGSDFTTNLYRLSGDWMRGTESVVPARDLTPGILDIGGHEIEIITLAGHTGEDIAILDRTCGVLYAGDLVFNRRTLSTPHAELASWMRSTDILKSLEFDTLVPGHGAIANTGEPIEDTRNYLEWLDDILIRSYESGLDITEVMELPLPGAFSDYSLARDEYRRTVHNLFPDIEATQLPLINESQ